jgi:uncharacterized protein (TIGR03435 family)
MDLRWTRYLILAAASLSLHAQTAPLQFEVASMKATVDPTLAGIIKRMPGERGYFGANMPLMAYIRIAYQLRDSQITSPDWLSRQNYDLDAKAEKPSTPDELHVMLQQLLLERFHMKVRRETREQSGFVLVVEKGGVKMQDHDPEDKVILPIMPGSGTHVGTNVTMPYFAFYLSNELDKTVVDKTGLDGHYDFRANWMAEGANVMPMQMAPPSPDNVVSMEMRASMAPMPSMPTIFVALKQLGLRLDPAKVPAEHLVIEHIEQLTEN